MGGRNCLVLAPLTLRFCKTAHCHPSYQPIAWTGEGEGNQTAPIGVEELSHLRNLTLVQHITCVGEWETQNCSYRYYWERLTNETCPWFNWTQSTAGIWTGAHISGVLKSTDVFCPNTCLFLCALRFYILMPLTDLFLILFFCHDLKQCFLISYFIITLLVGELLKSNCWKNVWGFGGCWTQQASSHW